MALSRKKRARSRILLKIDRIKWKLILNISIVIDFKIDED